MSYSDEFKRFFQFSNSERKGFFVLASIVVLLLFFLQIDFFTSSNVANSEHPDIDTSVFENFGKVQNKVPNKAYIKFEKKIIENKISDFIDLNRADKAALVATGIYPNIADRIVKYRTKGGRFRDPSDVKKIFGFTDKLYERIGHRLKVDTIIPSKSDLSADQKSSSGTFFTPISYNLNHVGFKVLMNLLNDSQMVLSVLKFRTALGGYYHLSQLSEVRGLSDTAIKILASKCIINDEPISRKLNLNLAEAFELRRHPYIQNKLAQLIIAYRQNKPFLDIEELKKIPVVDQSLFDKLKHYVFVTPNG